MIDLLILCVVLGLVAYCVKFLSLPEPFGKIIQVVLVVILIVGILRFAGGGQPILFR